MEARPDFTTLNYLFKPSREPVAIASGSNPWLILIVLCKHNGIYYRACYEAGK
jgi:hypothetical protein